MEFNTATKPYMIADLLRQGHDAVLYFDPDIEIFAALDGILEKLDQGASFVLTPHLLKPAEGASDPDDVAIMRAGVYNLGFLGVGATAEASLILGWWARRLRYQCVNEQSNGLFVDQKFVDLMPGFADRACILRDSRYNVAYWNLSQRELAQHGNGWWVDGSHLGFFHFSGFDPSDRRRLSKHSKAFRGDAISPALAALMQHYASLVIANGYAEALTIPYAYGKFASGAPISAQARQIFRTQYPDWSGDPFSRFEAYIPALDPAPPASREDLARQVQAMQASRSWRVTRPLRMIRRLLQG